MFDQLTDAEAYALWCKLSNAEHQFRAEFDRLFARGLVTHDDLKRFGYDAPMAGAYAWQAAWAESIELQLAL